MLPDDLPTSRSGSSGLPRACRATHRCRPATIAVLCASLLVGSCSSLPEHHHPQHIDHTFHASFLVGEDGRLPFPATTRDLVVRTMRLQPKPTAEQFDRDQRWLLYPAGTTVHAHGQLRAYADGAGRIPPLQELLPGAKLHADQSSQSSSQNQ